MRLLPSKRYFDFMGRSKIWFALSGVLILVAIVALAVQGLNFGIDFTGGTELTVVARPGVEVSDVRKVTAEFGFADAKIQAGADNTFIIRVPELDEQQRKDLIGALDAGVGLQREVSITPKPGTTAPEVSAALAKLGYQDVKIETPEEGEFTFRLVSLDEQRQNDLTQSLTADLLLQEPPEVTVLADVKEVGPGWGGQVTRQAIIALLVFLVAILIYISIRFEFKMAIAAIVALFHDVIIAVGVYALVAREVTPATVIAILTILGYSLYDTIVIFDRIKENTDQLTRQSKKTYSEAANDSINQVLARSINTSLTTLIPIIAILLFGGETLKDFAFALFVGVLAGTYSSIFIASPVLCLWKETEPKYRTFRERAQRTRAKERKAAAGGQKPAGRQKPAAAASRAKPAPAAPRAQRAKQPAAKKKPATSPKPTGDKGTGKAAEPLPKPKPKPKQSSGKSQKSSAKSRTKGPGGGKKKKKRR